jgi:hypothetical protein
MPTSMKDHFNRPEFIGTILAGISGLLAPMPTFAPGVSSVQIPQATSTEKPVFNWNSIILTGVGLMEIGIFFVLSIRWKPCR